MNRTVSGCAIILLVDQVTGIATQSYASDAALLDELQAGWPPAGATDAPAGEERGYVRVAIDGLKPVAGVRLADHFAVALALAPDAKQGVFVVLPLVRDGGGWRVARPGDGLSAFVAGVPFASERAVGVDQTHESVVVGERAIIKWFREVGPRPSRAAELVAHLAAVDDAHQPDAPVPRSQLEGDDQLGPATAAPPSDDERSAQPGPMGRPRSQDEGSGQLQPAAAAPRSQHEQDEPSRSDGEKNRALDAPPSHLRSQDERTPPRLLRPHRLIPRPLGFMTWRAPTGVELTFAQGDEYLPGARDGWEWCVERVPGDASLGRELAELIRDLHVALATPSAVIPDPVATAPSREPAKWRERALASFDTVFADADPELAAIAPLVRADIDAIPTDRPIPIQPVHGDLHVGQVLAWSGGLAVIDFDGNPTIGTEANAIRQPRERDIAQMLSSLDHVGRVVDQRSGWTQTVDVEAWITATRAAFLASVGPINPRLLAAFEAEQECRELVYATRFLPRWRYAPRATLSARYDSRPTKSRT